MNPLAAFQRWRVNRALKVLARYEGATWSPSRSYVPAGYQSVRFDATAHSRAELARKMRYFERNDELVQALAGKFENFVVGATPQVTAASSNPEWNAKAQERFNGWTQFCDIGSRQDFGTQMSLVARRWFVEGDIFILKTFGSDLRDPLQRGVGRPRLKLIEGHLCRTPPKLEREPDIHDGVRFDTNTGRALEYFFAAEVKQNEYEWGPPTDANTVIHVMESERPGELRGITFFHSCINALHDISDLDMLEMQAAKQNSSRTDWIETAGGDLDAANIARIKITGGVTTNTGAAATQDKVQYYQDISGGRTRVMQRGDKIHQDPGERPSVTTVDYWRWKKEKICAAVEIPYCIVFPDSMQGTVYRGALDMATTAFKSRHAVMARVMREVWAFVIGEEIKRGESGLADPPFDWRNVSIMPPRAPNVDVGRNATAEKEALLDGRTNYDMIYGPLGLDARTELTKYNAQLEFIEKNCPALMKLMQAQNAPAPAQIPETTPTP